MYSTPRLTEHARRRACEMEIGTKLVKRLAREHDLRISQPDGRVMVKGRVAPALTLVVAESDLEVLVITVLWNTVAEYDRRTGQPLEAAVAAR